MYGRYALTGTTKGPTVLGSEVAPSIEVMGVLSVRPVSQEWELGSL